VVTQAKACGYNRALLPKLSISALSSAVNDRGYNGALRRSMFEVGRLPTDLSDIALAKSEALAKAGSTPCPPFD